jgi:flagellar basal-body rod protein FlgG
VIDSLFIGETGLVASQTNLDVISNNMANINTNGFKKNKVNFEDLVYRTVSESPRLLGNDGYKQKIGSGTNISSTEKVFTDGNLIQTDNPLDIAVSGAGLFEVIYSNNELAYTRNGSFKVNNDGLLATTEGYVLSDIISVPSDAKSILIQQDGEVFADVFGQDELVSIGEINIANFINNSGLDPIGRNLYLSTENSGEADMGTPGDNGLGVLNQGFLEASNVDVTEEIVNLVLAQQGFQLNAKVIQASDDLLSITNDLYR